MISDLAHAGFRQSPARGSHRKFTHPRGSIVILSGASGDDAKPYQERDVRRKIEESRS